MIAADKPRFFLALKTVEEVCGDLMNEIRLRAYWLVLAPRCTLEEWEAACVEILAAWTMYRTPLPGDFLQALSVVKERRKAAFLVERQHAREQAWRQAEAASQHVLADAAAAGDHNAAMRECMHALEGILGPGWRSLADVDAVGMQRTRDRRRAPVLATHEQET